MNRVPVLLAACLAMPGQANAQAIVDQVERLDVESGEIEWEQQGIYASAGEGDVSARAINFSGELGLSERFALGFELETARDGAEHFEAEMLALQTKFVALDPRETTVGLGAQLSLGRALHGDETEVELRLLAETRVIGLVLAGDLMLEHALAGDEPHDIATRYATRLDWPQTWGLLAVEAGGEWGVRGDLSWSGEDRHWLGPVVGVNLTDRFRLEAGYFAGLSEATPDSQLRIEIALRQ